VHAADTAFVLFDSAWSPPKIALHEEHQIGLADECGRRSSADQLRGLAVLRPVIFSEEFARSARLTSAAALAGPWPPPSKDYHKVNTLSTRNLPENDLRNMVPHLSCGNIPHPFGGLIRMDQTGESELVGKNPAQSLENHDLRRWSARKRAHARRQVSMSFWLVLNSPKAIALRGCNSYYCFFSERRKA
jgi:hypothetical protein